MEGWNARKSRLLQGRNVSAAPRGLDPMSRNGHSLGQSNGRVAGEEVASTSVDGLVNGNDAADRPSTVIARFSKDTLWSVIGNTVMQGASFCSTLIIARLLTKNEFGQYAIFLSSVALLAVIAELGLGIAISTTTAKLRDVSPAQLGRRLAAAYWAGGVVAVGLNCILFLLWTTFGRDLLSVKLDTHYLPLLAITVLVNVASVLQVAELSGYQSFQRLALAQGLRGVVLVGLCAAAAMFFRLQGVIVAGIVATVASIAVQMAALKKERRKRSIKLGVRPRWNELSPLLSCSVPAFGNHVANAAGNWGGPVVVVLCSQAGVASVAEYGAASQVRNFIQFLPSIVGQVLMPTVANLGSQQRDGKRLVRLSMAGSTAVAMVLAAAILLFRREVALLFGPAYVQAAGTVALIAVGGVIYVAQSTMCYALIGYGRIRWVCGGAIITAVVFVVIAGLLITLEPNLGSRSLGWAFILSSSVQLAVVLAGFRRPAKSSREAGMPRLFQQPAGGEQR